MPLIRDEKVYVTAGKSEKEPNFVVRVNWEGKRLVERVAAQDGQSVSSFVRMAVNRYLASKDDENPSYYASGDGR